MKTMVQIEFQAGQFPDKIDEILALAGCGPDVARASGGFLHFFDPKTNKSFADVTVTIHLDEGDHRIAKVLALVKEFGKEFGEEADLTTFKVYSEQDRQNARLLLMANTDDFMIGRGSQAGTKFDMTKGCENCGTGVKQTWYLRVRRKDLPKVLEDRAKATRSNEIMVDLDLRQKLVDAGISGISFAEVHARNENDEWIAIAREQILIEHTMPPIRAEFPAEGEKAVCRVCRRGGHMVMPQNPLYREEDLTGMQDFNLTWEWFGGYGLRDRVRECVFARPEVLVTPKVMNIFRDAGVKSFEWTPVAIEG